jgi:16S rRNA U1498 N3-methylase RsmE
MWQSKSSIPSVSKYLSLLTFCCNFDHSSYSKIIANMQNDKSSLKCVQHQNIYNKQNILYLHNFF